MLETVFRIVGRVQLILAGLAVALILCEPTARRYGDRLQIALPLLAWACTAAQGKGSEFFARFTGMMVLAHGSKSALGETPLNARPAGGSHGFPSAHTSAAVLGASSLAHDCVPGKRGTVAAVMMAAGFVGASRIEAGKHDIWQVLAGALLGWGCDRALRRNQVLRSRIAGATGRLRRGIGDLGSAAAKALRGLLAEGFAGVRSRLSLGLQHVTLALLISGGLTVAHPALAEMEISIYGGMQGAGDSEISVSGQPDQSVDWKGKSFEAPPYYGLRATWWKSETLGFGIEINHAKVYAGNAQALGYERMELTDGMNLVTANVWRRWPDAGWGGGKLVPYVGAGLGVAVPHVDITPAGQEATFGYQITGPAVQAVAGVAWEFREGWSVFGELKASWSRHKADLDSGGTFETDISTGAVNIGLSRRF